MTKLHVQIHFATEEDGVLQLCQGFDTLDEMVASMQTVALDMAPMADHLVEIETSGCTSPNGATSPDE